MKRIGYLSSIALAAWLAAPITPALALPVTPAPGVPLVRTVAGVRIVEQADPAEGLVGVMLFLRAGLDRQPARQNGVAALAAAAILRTPVNGVPLDRAVRARGGSVSYVVEPRTVRFYVQGLADRQSQILALFESALAHPLFNTATIASARAILDQQIAQAQRIPLRVGLEMLDRSIYAGSNGGWPADGTPATLAFIGPTAVQAFYTRNYRSGGSTISAVGKLAALPSGTLTGLARTLPGGTPSRVAVARTALMAHSRQFVTHRSIQAPWLIARYQAPPLGSKDFGAMLVLASFLQRTVSQIAGLPPLVSRDIAGSTVGAFYRFDRRPASLVLYVDGALGAPQQVFSTALSVVHVVANSKFTGSIGGFKRIAAGSYAIGATSLRRRAWLAGIFVERGLPADYIGSVIAQVNATTPADVQRVAKRYLTTPWLAFVLPRPSAVASH